jgi:4-diphosphocytidyl-2-C-methyl-D-erythritol kinase
MTGEIAAPAVSRGRPWPAPAKLNLFLHILRRRPDGYHDLQTCFQFVDLCDQIDLGVRADGLIRRVAGADDVAADADLTVRAARALQQATGSTFGADIAVTKRIPMGAGLGGGSSDAATTLVGLNQLWKTGLTTDQLADLGLGLGADVPVFVRGRVAWGEGVGERLVPLYGPAAPAETYYVIVKPPVSISTASVFQDPELTRNTPPITIEGFLSGGGRNDCEAVVRARYPAVGAALDSLARFGAARLTGTGACVFVDCGTSARGHDLLRELSPGDDGVGVEAYVVRGLNDSPLLERLAAG